MNFKNRSHSFIFYLFTFNLVLLCYLISSGYDNIFIDLYSLFTTFNLLAFPFSPFINDLINISIDSFKNRKQIKIERQIDFENKEFEVYLNKKQELYESEIKDFMNRLHPKKENTKGLYDRAYISYLCDEYMRKKRDRM